MVDEHDHVVGQLGRGEVHRRALMHRACHIVLTNTAGEVFVQLRSRSKQANPGLWDTSAAGHVDAGETYRDCAVRELAEELGVILTPSELDEVARLSPSLDTGLEHVVLYHAVSDQAMTLEADEIDDGRWVTVGDLQRWLAREPHAFTTVFANIWSIMTSRALP